MCLDSDLFGEVIISFSDVDIWLSEVCRFDENTPSTKKAQYIKQYPLATIIASAKRSGYFYVVKAQHELRIKQQSNRMTELYPPRYVETLPPVPPACPSFFHHCNNVNCPIFIKNEKRAYSRGRYLARNKSRKSL